MICRFSFHYPWSGVTMRTACSSIAAFAVLCCAINLGFAEESPTGPRAGQIDEGADTATHVEIEPLPVSFGELTVLRWFAPGKLLAGDGKTKEIHILDYQGTILETWTLDFPPEAVAVGVDVVYVGGGGTLARLDRHGHVQQTVPIPDDAATPQSQQRRMAMRPLRCSGMALSDDYVFVAFGSGWSLGSKSKLYRFRRDLSEPVQLAEGLRGCCQRCDLVYRDGVLYLAENAAHRVVCLNVQGKVLAKWGAAGRTGLENFGSCCNPMNLSFGNDGSLYTAESGLGRVKRYSPQGEYLDLVGYVGVARFTSAGRMAASCSNIAIAVAPDADRVFVMDYKNGIIRVLARKQSD
ncbi:hypothetical protein JCM19992_31530 [Thermostilla marina]